MFRTGVLHISDAGCALVLQADLEYWGVDESSMEACCTLKYYPKIEVCQSERDGEIATKRQEMELAEEEDFGNSDWGQMRSYLWNTMVDIKTNIFIFEMFLYRSILGPATLPSSWPTSPS